jgi:hypothetical protein
MLDFRLVKVGAVLAGAGMMLATAGTGLLGLALSRAAREWMRQREVSPTALAAGKMRQARHASVAGAHAWKNYPVAASNGAGANRS